MGKRRKEAKFLYGSRNSQSENQAHSVCAVPHLYAPTNSAYQKDVTSLSLSYVTFGLYFALNSVI